MSKAPTYSLDMEFTADSMAEIETKAHARAEEFFGDLPYDLGNAWVRPAKKGGRYKVSHTAYTPREKRAPIAGIEDE